MRIAVLLRDRCKPKNCSIECIKFCPRVRAGDETVVIGEDGKPVISEDLCVGCGICVEKCPIEAIQLNDENKAERNPDWCIGCGVCAHFCPENAISLHEGMRKVYIPPPRLRG